jgi:transposase-like protein
MDGYFEVYEDGTVRAWVCKEGKCPRCGAEVEIHKPYRCRAPVRVLCEACGYEKGYENKIPVMGGSLEFLPIYSRFRKGG